MAKNIYIGVDNVARKVKQPYIGINNIARKVKSGFIGVDNVARQFYKSGITLSSLAVGTVVYLKEGGTSQEYLVVNQGIPSGSSLYDASCNGTWLLRKDIIASSQYAANKTNVYENSDIHSWLNSTMLSKYDAYVQSLIKQVKIPYRSGGGKSGTNQIGANGLSCKLFLLSTTEVGCTTQNQVPDIGAVLSYFSGLGNGDERKRVAYWSVGSNRWQHSWWTRTQLTDADTTFMLINANGSPSGWDAYQSAGVRPALIMPFDTAIDKNMNIITA